MSKWIEDYTKRHEYDDVEGHDIWDQKIKYNQKERAKMIMDTMDAEPELLHEFNLLLRQKKLDQLKNV